MTSIPATAEQWVADLRVYADEYDTAFSKWLADASAPPGFTPEVAALIEAGAGLMGWVESYLEMVDKEGTE